MSLGILLFLFLVCLVLIYVVHRYFDKNYFYLLTIIYIVTSLLTSFKLINIFGIDINANIMFYLGIISIIYYFVNRYSYDECKKFFHLIIITLVFISITLILTSLFVPSLYDLFGSNYTNLMFNNILTIILNTFCLSLTSLLSFYTFNILKNEKDKKTLKFILTLVGILFIDSFLFSYFSYAFTYDFKYALMLSINNYLMRVLFMSLDILLVNKIFKVVKVK